MNSQIRFSKRPNRPKKNTLFTILNGNNLYFGISKLNNKVDTWDREEGVKRAKARASSAQSKDYEALRSFMTKDGLSGKCLAKDAVEVLKHFRRMR